MQTQNRIVFRSTSILSRSLRTNRHPKQLWIHLLHRVLTGALLRRHQAKRFRRLGTTVRSSGCVIRHEIEYVVAEGSHLFQLLRQKNVLLPQSLVLVQQLCRHSRRRRVRRDPLLLHRVRRRHDRLRYRNRGGRQRRQNRHASSCSGWQRRGEDLPSLNFAEKPLLASSEILVGEFPPIRHNFSESLKIKQD